MNELEEPRPPNCISCEYINVCEQDRDNGQKIDYCPDERYEPFIRLAYNKEEGINNEEINRLSSN
jgi:hypothetical protein